MAFQVPTSWTQSATALLLEYYGTESVVPSHRGDEEDDDGEDEYNEEYETLPDGPALNKFRQNDFRENFFRAVGHRYVMAIQRIFTDDPATKRFTKAKWAIKLGVSSTTPWRWSKDRNFAGAEKFFAVQLLVVDWPLARLSLPTNDEILLQSILAMYSSLNKKYRSFRAKKPITTEVFRTVHELMRVMRSSPDDVYNPFDDTRTKKSNDAALKVLANYIHDNRDSFRGTVRSAGPPKAAPALPIVLPSDVKMWLDTWGMPYAIFALGNRLSWKQIGDFK